MIWLLRPGRKDFECIFGRDEQGVLDSTKLIKD